MQAVFDCVKRAPPNCLWTLENVGESPNSTNIQPFLRLAIELDSTTRTCCDDSRFMSLLTNELCNIKLFSEHLQHRSIYLIRNCNSSDVPLEPHSDGILPTMPILINLLQWWCMWTESHGYGVFHQPAQDPSTLTYSVVSFTEIFHHLKSSRFLKATPFGNAVFAHTFQVAAYAMNHPGYFDLGKLTGNNSEVSLYTAAFICGWVSILCFRVQCLIVDA